MEQEDQNEGQGHLLNREELKAVIDNEELSSRIRMELRLKEQTGVSSPALILIIKELQIQQARIDQILEQLTLQNELLAGFQLDMLRQLQENTRAALREQLTEMNKQRLRDLREIKEAMDRAVRMLVSQERRISKIEANMDAVLRECSKQ